MEYCQLQAKTGANKDKTLEDKSLTEIERK